MSQIEPNIAAALAFALFASVTSLGAIVLAGAFPLSTRPELTRPMGLALVVANSVLMIVVLYLIITFGLNQLRWTSVVILAGFAVLFAPGLFNIWPSRWRDGRTGLILTLAGLALSAWALAQLS